MVSRNSSKEPRLSLQSIKVLQVFASNMHDELAGSDLQKLTRLSSGTLYPILLRFEKAGWLKSHWEKVDPTAVGRPRKRLYQISPTGLTKAHEVINPFAGGIPA